jgi:hypothetical protein
LSSSKIPGLKDSKWPVLLLALVAAVVLWQDRGIGAKLDIVPDSTEYAWMITGLEPAYLEYVTARDSRRRIVP